jgi:hypothetical protein
MNVFHVSKGKPEGLMTTEEEKKFDDVNIIFTRAVLSILVDHLVDANMKYTDGKELWNALTTMYGASDVGSDLYVIVGGLPLLKVLKNMTNHMLCNKDCYRRLRLWDEGFLLW